MRYYIDVEFEIVGKATIENKKWTSEDSILQKRLNSFYTTLEESPSTPFVEYWITQEIFELLPGKITKMVKPEYEAGVIY